MNTSDFSRQEPETERGEHCVVLHSIGTGGASVVAALEKVTEVPSAVIAARLFRAPSVLFANIAEDVAQQAAAALSGVGLECAVQPMDEPVDQGDSDHELALVVRDFSRMTAVLESVANLVGIDLLEARKLLCSCPTMLLGRVSKATAEAIERRFEPLGVEVDISRRSTARYDVFLGDEAREMRARAEELATGRGIPVLRAANDTPQPLLAAELPIEQAESLWDELIRGRIPAKIINRGFQRLDLRLERAPDTKEFREFLVSTAGMPERVVPRVLAALPIVTHPNLRFADLCKHLEEIGRLGGSGTGQLIAFHRFGLRLARIDDPEAARQRLRGIGGLSEEAAGAAVSAACVEGPLSHPQARWLQAELDRVGTLAKLEPR